MRRLLDEQVTLIKSIPLDAAKRVHRLTLEGIENSGRASEVAKEIMRSGEVAKSRATLIARTETSRTATVLTQARAEHIGSDGYVWRTSGDSDVRPSHRRMNGKFVPWNHPPTLDNLTGHAGALPNCRCYPEPVIPE
jgi:SPP1 gp7 family putative phage head morphogenesis protein